MARGTRDMLEHDIHFHAPSDGFGGGFRWGVLPPQAAVGWICCAIAHRGVPRIVIISDAEISSVISVRFAREIHTLDKKLNHYP